MKTKKEIVKAFENLLHLHHVAQDCAQNGGKPDLLEKKNWYIAVEGVEEALVDLKQYDLQKK